MNEIRDQLIPYLQSVINKRMSDQKASSVSCLVGVVSQFKEFRVWLQNNYRNDFKTNLLELIQEDRHHFNYDFNTGIVSINNLFELNPKQVLTPNVFKPKLLTDLENFDPKNTFDDNLSVFELIIFIFKEMAIKSMVVSDLMQMIVKKCENQFNYFKSKVKIKDQKIFESEVEINSLNESVLIYLTTTLLNPFFCFDSSEGYLRVNTMEVNMSQIVDYLSQTCLILVKNTLITHLYRFGRKSLIDLNNWFNKFEFISEFMSKSSITLDQFIGLYPEVFNLRVLDWTTKVIDLNPEVIGNTRYLEFELMYKYGTQIIGIFGTISNVMENCATIESQIDFFINDNKFRPNFKVISDYVKVMGQEVFDLRAFVHFGDRICFDVKFISNFDDLKTKQIEKSHNFLWIVTRIYCVKHSAKCFVHSFYDDWNWKCISNNSEDSDDSYHIEGYDKERQSSDTSFN